MAAPDDAGQLFAAAHRSRPRSRSALRRAQVVSVDRVREGPPLSDLGTLQEVCSKQLWADAGDRRPCTRRTRPRLPGFGLPARKHVREVPTVLDGLLKTVLSLHHIIPASRLPLSAHARLNDGKAVTAQHHPDARTREPLSSDEREGTGVYRLIRAHYLAQFLLTTSSTASVAELSPAASRSWRPPESRWSSEASGAAEPQRRG